MQDSTSNTPLGSVQLESHARELGKQLQVASNPSDTSSQYFAAFEEDVRTIAEAHAVATQWARQEGPRSPVVEWLLDNYYIISEKIRDIRQHLPKKFFRELPKVPNGQARIQVVANELLLHSDSALDEQRIVDFANHFQSSAELTIGETWAFAIMLKLGLIEQLKFICTEMMHDFQSRQQTLQILEQIEARQQFDSHALRSLNRNSSIIDLYNWCREQGNPHVSFRAVLQDLLDARGVSITELQRIEQQRLAACQVSIGNIITSLRLLDSLEWNSVFESINLTDRILRNDPARIYPEMDFQSRNRYRDAIEQLSRGSQRAESAIAAQVIDLCTTAIAQQPEEQKLITHVGYWLVDEGRREVERAIGYRGKFWNNVVAWMKRHASLTYLGGITLITLLGLWAIYAIIPREALNGWAVLGLLLLGIIPSSELAVQCTNWLLTKLLPVHLLPKIALKDRLPEDYPTFIVIPSMFGSERDVATLMSKLENHFLASPEQGFSFGLLTDFADADAKHQDNDERIIELALDGIHKLNAQYGRGDTGPFFLFHRERRWNAREKRWMGWERKRGKLVEFGKLLLGDEQTSYIIVEGDRERLKVFQDPAKNPLIVTLDSDTVLPRTAARELVGTLIHPLNRPVLDPNRHGIVKRGYTILQPRVGILMDRDTRSHYQYISSSAPGIDPYVTATSDVYQDLYAEGSFTGKGIYDLKAFDRVLEGRFPENRILSHDLIEGCFARAGLASDVEVFDSYPQRYDADAKRHHRWVRGDWQIAAWAWPWIPSQTGIQRNPLSLLSHWKILDNLRRSLYPISMLLFLIVAWMLAPSHSIAIALIGALWVFVPTLLQLVEAISLARMPTRVAGKWKTFANDVYVSAQRNLMQAMFLPHRALSMADAILRTMLRLYVTHRKLLEWETAAATEVRLMKQRRAVVRMLVPCSVLGALVIALAIGQGAWGVLPWSAIWLIAPIVGQIVSQPRSIQIPRPAPTDTRFLYEILAATWGYFEKFVDPKTHPLPPDNFQEYPRPKIAYRTSPTNEGLFLVSAIAAQRFQLITIPDLLELLEANLKAWFNLEQRHGHHYNWYETVSASVLRPRYVSTVDSGNLLACYLTLTNAIAETIKAPLVSESRRDAALANLDWLRRNATSMEQASLADPHATPAARESAQKVSTALDSLQGRLPAYEKSYAWIAAFERWLEEAADELEQELPNLQAATRGQSSSRNDVMEVLELVVRRCRRTADELRQVFPWMVDGSATDQAEETGEPAAQKESRQRLMQRFPPDMSLAELAQLPSVVRLIQDETTVFGAAGTQRIQQGMASAAEIARDWVDRLEAIRQQCQKAASAMDFHCLFDERRKLFSIGFNADVNALDRSAYDLLCSECRLTSYLAIGKGDVDSEHWFRLGRPTTEIDHRFAILSWGGTMFEYLMPAIFQRTFYGSLLDRSCNNAILSQIEYGAAKNTPWGISESAYSAMASNSDYQYKSFGVPGLGLKRGLAKDHVISPYSTALALHFMPDAAIENLKALAKIALGPWGFYDAVDYTRSRLRLGESHRVVQNYMAHHHGMTVLSIVNCLTHGLIQRWFHAHPIVRANELLLQEKAPNIVQVDNPNADELQENFVSSADDVVVSRQIRGIRATAPRVLVLSNGKASSLMTHTGGSAFHYHQKQITRWRSDTTRDHWGTFVYLRDLDTLQVWSATYQPTRVVPDDYEAIFSIDKGEIRRRQGDIETHLELVVSPEHDAEVRQLKIANHGKGVRTIEVTSFAELSMIPERADRSHPAFYKLFVETEYIAEDNSLVARRRPRDKRDTPFFTVHTMALPASYNGTVQFDSSRETFIGRYRTAENPVALEQAELARTTGAVLDPIVALRCVLTIQPGESITVGIATSVAETREQALNIADLYHDLRGVMRAFELAWAYSQVEMRHLNLTAHQIHTFQRLAGALLYPDRRFRADPRTLAANRLGQSSLWRFGISGDAPLVLIRVTAVQELELVKELLHAYRFLNLRGVRLDLVICNDYPGTYYDAIQDQIHAMMESILTHLNLRNVFALRGAQLTREDHTLLDSVASVFLKGEQGSLAVQLTAADTKALSTDFPTLHRSAQATELVSALLNSTTPKEPVWPQGNNCGRFTNGFGQFCQNEYHLETSRDHTVPAPWSNIVANEMFGCLITEAGSGFTWHINSRENKLSSWSNDPVSDPPSEIIYVYERGPGHLWSPLNRLDAKGHRQVVHGHGYSKFRTQEHGISSETIVWVDDDRPVKYYRIRFNNQRSQARSLRITCYVETVLGVDRNETALHQVSSFDAATNAVCMSNAYGTDFQSQVVYLTTNYRSKLHYSGDRMRFLGRDGSWINPVGATMELDDSTGAGLDPCLALQLEIELEPNGSKEIEFVLGVASELAKLAEELDDYLQPQTSGNALRRATVQWQETLGAVTVDTPNASFDVMVNDWLLYQTLACRIWGRSGFYQAGGAFGFRDQLQDIMALVYSRPEIARKHILRAAARQYLEGDVQHWWHPPSGKGTRTRFSDDFLFLPYAVLHYCRVTGDYLILDEEVGFLHSLPLRDDEHERYELPEVSHEKASLLEHCRRALKHGMRYGSHGLPLMGCGDWNDGMNRVGEDGKGESVWVAWFQIVIFREFADFLEARKGDDEFCQTLRKCANDLSHAIEEHAWDGQWYRRAFFDSGSPLGCATDEECQIDSLVQSWAVIAHGATPRSISAFRSAIDRLFLIEDGMVLLFKPPFDLDDRDPGYIQGYLPGVRENGGQYTHAALWMVLAATRLRDGNLAMELFDAINPIHHTSNEHAIELYRQEPYAVAADVYANEQHRGRGGWSWYTGSAGWMYRVAIENILGITIEEDRLTIRPCVPTDWPEFSFSLVRNKTRWHVRIVLDPDDQMGSDEETTIPLKEDGENHEYVVHLRNSSTENLRAAKAIQPFTIPV